MDNTNKVGIEKELYSIRNITNYKDYKIFKDLLLRLNSKNIDENKYFELLVENFVSFKDNISLDTLSIEDILDLEADMEEFVIDLVGKVGDSKKKLMKKVGNIKKSLND